MANLGCGCPGSMARVIEREETQDTTTGQVPSELRQWPIQLHLVPPTAPWFKNADLLKGKAIAIACPKLDETDAYVEKLAAIFRENQVKSISVAIMEVPCCHGLDIIVKQALGLVGVEIPLETVVIGINGERRN